MDLSKATFFGFRRDNGRVGVRNHVVILPVDDLSNGRRENVRDFEGKKNWLGLVQGDVKSEAVVKDLAKYPELRWLDRFDIIVPVLLAVGVFFLGMGLETWAPELGTNRWQMLVWGFFVSTVVLFHATVTINSLAHRWGRRRYATRDDSRNNLWLALLTFGEGWHNNHHHYPASARQGFYWWEVDLAYYGLRVLSALGLVWDLRPVPEDARRATA